MKVIHILASIFCVIALLAVMLISSVDIAVYGNKGYFQKEYQKYGVLKSININEKDLLYVTEEMMSYYSISTFKFVNGFCPCYTVICVNKR